MLETHPVPGAEEVLPLLGELVILLFYPRKFPLSMPLGRVAGIMCPLA